MSAFELTATSELARSGTLRTAHGVVETPVFMPVGTQASVKGVAPDELSACGIKMLLANAYHLYLRPGTAVIAAQGGLHRFMHWHGAILTDSGGFQVFSLARLARIDDDGYHFASHLDGSRHTFTPESVVAIQATLGSDVAMVLDQCAPAGIDEVGARAAADRTLLWAQRARACQTAAGQLTFAIAQGATFESLRRLQCRALRGLDFPGYAIGGLWVGEPRDAGLAMVSVCCEELPPDRPRYVMGVGTPEDIIDCIARGADMFDSVYPTRAARHALALTSVGRVNLRNAAHLHDASPLDPNCACATCARFSRAYLAHCLRAGEALGARLVSIHNIAYLSALMAAARVAIRERRFAAWRGERLETLRRQSAEQSEG